MTSAAALRAQARAAEDRADDLRTVAWQLDLRTRPLDSLVEPIADIHILDTWTGSAATSSRRRLDAHAAGLTGTRNSILDLADQLRAEATVADSEATSLWSAAATARSGSFEASTVWM